MFIIFIVLKLCIAFKVAKNQDPISATASLPLSNKPDFRIPIEKCTAAPDPAILPRGRSSDGRALA